MSATITTVLTQDLPRLIDSPDCGIISLVGSDRGLSLITGAITDSSLVMGTMSIETEHGTLYLDPEGEQEISTEQPDPEEVEDDEDRAQRAVTEYRGTLLGHLELVASLWNTDYGSLTITTTPDDGRIFTFVTGGWSENETLISALEGSFLTHTLTWMKSERGGLHDYSVEPSLFKLHIGS